MSVNQTSEQIAQMICDGTVNTRVLILQFLDPNLPYVHVPLNQHQGSNQMAATSRQWSLNEVREHLISLNKCLDSVQEQNEGIALKRKGYCEQEVRARLA